MTVVSNFQRGFTLLEAVIVIVVTGIIIAAVALFLRVPFQSYLDTSNRAQLTDTADTALRRIARDLHIALPNSVRVMSSGASTCMEMLPTKAGGRYRAVVSSNPPPNQGTILDFTQPISSFDMFGSFSVIPAQIPAANDLIVVYNLGPTSPGANAYAQNNTAAIASQNPDPNMPGETLINLMAPPKTLFPLASPGNRFQVIGNATLTATVSYVCTPGPLDALGNATGTLTRVSQYPIAVNQTCPPPGLTTAVLAENVLQCVINYTPLVQSNGVAQMNLYLEQSYNQVSMYHEVEVNNAP